MVSDVNVEVALPEGKRVRQVTLPLAGRRRGHRGGPQVENGRVRFTVPRLRTYTLAIIQNGVTAHERTSKSRN